MTRRELTPLFVVALLGCAHTPPRVSHLPPASPATHHVDPIPVARPALPAHARRASLPEELMDYEERVELMVDDVTEGAPISRVRHHDVLEIEAAWAPVREALEGRDADEELLELVEDRLIELARIRRTASRAELARALNGVAGRLDDVYASFRVDPELQLLELEYLAHELLLDARTEAWALGPHHATEAMAAWQSFERAASVDSTSQRVRDGRRYITEALTAADVHARSALERAADGLLAVTHELEREWEEPRG